MEYKEVKTKEEEVAEGKFNFAIALASCLDNNEIKWAVSEGLEELDEALCWRDGIDGDEYPYNHLPTNYIPLPLQSVKLEAEDENAMVVTLTYAPYEDCELELECEGSELHTLSTRHYDITEYEKGGYTQNDMKVVKRVYKLSRV